MAIKLSAGIFLLTWSLLSIAQAPKDILVGAYGDLIKTDNINSFDKAQIGLEGNYFLTRSFTATAGFEMWTAEKISFVVGARWFPAAEAFIRVRGLWGENDLALGGGWTKPINESMKFEAIGDFYFSVDFAIRVGIVYTIKRN